MFDNLNSWEVIALILLALFVFGPERLPKAISDGLSLLRKVRGMARNAASDLGGDLRVDNIQDLHPKVFIRKHLFSEEDEAQLRRPLEDIYRDIRQVTEEDLRQLPPPGLGRRSLSAGVVASSSPELNHQFPAPEVNHHDPSPTAGRHRALDEDIAGPTSAPD